MQTLKRPQPDIRAIARTVPPSGNLVQGQNDVAIHPELARSVATVVAEGLNHYSFFEGVDELRRAVAQKILLGNGVRVDTDAEALELIITPGATGGLITTAHTYLRGGSAVMFEPYYPYHRKILETSDTRVDMMKLRGHDLELDLDELRRVCREGAARSDHPTKAILTCSPANPTGRMFSRAELEAIVDCANEFDLLILSDEVYEHFAIEPGDHISPASIPGAFERTIAVNSFSKAWAISGWRLGYAYGPGHLVGRLATVGNLYYVCTPTPLQHALSRVLLEFPEYYDRLRSDFVRKREVLREALDRSGFRIYPSRSAFYIWARIPTRFSDATELNHFLMKEAGVAGVPGSAFMEDPEEDVYMRLCFAREDTMLEAAAHRIVKALG